MKTWVVGVTFEVKGWVHIKAETAEEAEEIARYRDMSEFNLDMEEVTDVDSYELKEKRK